MIPTHVLLRKPCKYICKLQSANYRMFPLGKIIAAHQYTRIKQNPTTPTTVTIILLNHKQDSSVTDLKNVNLEDRHHKTVHVIPTYGIQKTTY